MGESGWPNCLHLKRRLVLAACEDSSGPGTGHQHCPGKVVAVIQRGSLASSGQLLEGKATSWSIPSPSTRPGCGSRGWHLTTSTTVLPEV